MSANKIKIVIDGEEDSISVESFLSVARNTLNLLKHLSEETRWTIGEVSHNSPLNIEYVGEGNLGTASEAIVSMMDGIDSIMRTRTAPPSFDLKAIGYARRISKPLTSGLSSVILESENRNAVRVSKELFSAAEEALGPDHYYAFTELEGVLEMIKFHGGIGELAIIDRLTGAATKCKFTSDEPESLGMLISHPVRVFGRARYNREHTATSISIEEWAPLASPVSIDELHAKEFSLTGDVSAERLIRSLRDMDV